MYFLQGPPKFSTPQSKSITKIHFPKELDNLQKLVICPKYEFESDSYETKNPTSKRWREVRLDLDSDDDDLTNLQPLKTTLSLEHTKFPKLETMVLGNLVELEEFGFSTLQNLKTFRYFIIATLYHTYNNIMSKNYYIVQRKQFVNLYFSDAEVDGI